MQTYSSSESKRVFLNEFTTYDMINKMINDNNYTSYLELGYKEGFNFNRIVCESKVAIGEYAEGDEFEKDLPYGACYLRDDNSLLIKETPEDFLKEATPSIFAHDIIFMNKGTEHLAAKVAPLLTSNGVIIMVECPEKVIHPSYTVFLLGDLLIAKRKDERVDIH